MNRGASTTSLNPRKQSIVFYVCAGLPIGFAASGLGSVIVGAEPAQRGVASRPCPADAIPVPPGNSIQAAVDQGGRKLNSALRAVCIERRLFRPKNGQHFYGEGGSVLNGSRKITDFKRAGKYWIAESQTQNGERHGECANSARLCRMPEAVFIDDAPLKQVERKKDLVGGSFLF